MHRPAPSGAGHRAGPAFWKVWFCFLFHYESADLKSVLVFKVSEDRCIYNFENVGFSVFVSPVPNSSSAMAWPYLTLVLPGTCSPRGCMDVQGLSVQTWKQIYGRRSQIEKVNHVLSEWHIRFLYVWVFIYAKTFKETTHLFWESKSWVSGSYGHSNWSLNRTHKWTFLNISKCARSPEQPSISLCGQTLTSHSLQKTVTSTLLVLTAKQCPGQREPANKELLYYCIVSKLLCSLGW